MARRSWKNLLDGLGGSVLTRREVDVRMLLKQPAWRPTAALPTGGDSANPRNRGTRLPSPRQRRLTGKGKSHRHDSCRIQQDSIIGGARPCTPPPRPWTTVRSGAWSIPKRDEDGPVRRIPSDGSGIRNTNGVEMDPAGAASTDTWETLLPSRYFPFLMATALGARALHPSNATSAMTQGINANGTGRLWEAVIGNQSGSFRHPNPP